MIIINFNEETITSKTVFKGNILNLKVKKVKLPDNSQGSREIIEHSGGATIIPVTTDNNIIMVKQYRKAPEEILLELPAGKLEKGESPLECVKRELEEETGYRAHNIKKLFSFYTSPGYSNEILHLFIGEQLEFTSRNPDPGEFIERIIIKPEEIMDLIFDGKIKDSKTIIGLLYFLRGDY